MKPIAFMTRLAPAALGVLLALTLALPVLADDDPAPPPDPCATKTPEADKARVAELTAKLGTDATGEAWKALAELGSDGCKTLAGWLMEGGPGGTVADRFGARMFLSRAMPAALPGAARMAATDNNPHVTAVIGELDSGGPAEAEAFAAVAAEQAQQDGRYLEPWIDPLQSYVVRSMQEPAYTGAGIVSARALGLAEGPGIDQVIDQVLEQDAIIQKQGLAAGLAERIAAGLGDEQTQARLDRLTAAP